MKESLAARQAALLKQNAELNERVEAIEQRRQQQRTVSSSASSLSNGATGSQPAGRPGEFDKEEDETEQTSDDVFQSDLEASAGYGDRGKRASRAPPQQGSLKMDLSASIDSFGSKAADEDEPYEPAQQPDTRDGEQRSKARQRMKRQGSADEAKFPKSADDSQGPNNNNNSRRVIPAHGGDDTPEGLGLEATVRYQKARLRVLQDEVDTANSQVKELVSVKGVQLTQFRL